MKRFLIPLLGIMLCIAVRAQDRAKVSCGPYLQNVTTTSFTVMWETDIDAMVWVEVAPDSGDHWYNRGRARFWEDNGTGLLPLGKIHKVEVTGLEPGKRYRYRLMMRGLKEYKGSGKVTFLHDNGTDVFRKKPFMVSTLSTSYDSLKFSVLNDMHQKDSLVGVLLKAAPDNDFVVFNGDMTNDIMDSSKISEYYLRTASAALGGSTPLYVLRGNHDYRGRCANCWNEHFCNETGRAYTAFSYGKYFFIGLDSGEDKPDDDLEYSGLYRTLPYLQQEAKWLKEIVKTKEFRDAKVRIVFSHIPPESKGWQGNRNVCELFVPILNEAGIDLMICGHTHKYRFDTPQSDISPASFPVWVNANVERLDVTIGPGGSIELKAFNPDGIMTHSSAIRK